MDELLGVNSEDPKGLQRASCGLSFSRGTGMTQSMSTKAQAILEEIKALPLGGAARSAKGLAAILRVRWGATRGTERIDPERARPVCRQRFVGSVAGRPGAPTDH